MRVDDGGVEGRMAARTDGMMATPRRTKHSRVELRALLLETGRALLREEGLGTGAETLTFKRVFERVERDTGLRLTNASIIRRVWANQAEYQTEVLMAVAADPGDAEVDQTLDAVASVFEDLDVSSVEARWLVMRQLCRVAGAANVQALRNSPNWPTWIGVWALATADTLPDRPAGIDEALLEGYEGSSRRFVEAYAAITALLGFRLREGFTLRQFAIAVGALAEGCALRSRVDAFNMEGIIRYSGPEGQPEEWMLFAIGLEAMVGQFLEIDPDWEAPPSPPEMG